MQRKKTKENTNKTSPIFSGSGVGRLFLFAFLIIMALSVSQVFAGNGDVSITVTTEALGTDITASSTVEAMCAGGAYQTCSAASPAICTNAVMVAGGG